MTKVEMEKTIIEKIKKIVDSNNESDKHRREWMEKEIEYGTNPDFFKDVFLFNGYFFMTQLIDIISIVMFNHESEEYIAYESRFRGVPRYNNYRNILTKEEEIKIDKVISGMVKANIIKVSKSKTMVKLIAN